MQPFMPDCLGIAVPFVHSCRFIVGSSHSITEEMLGFEVAVGVRFRPVESYSWRVDHTASPKRLTARELLLRNVTVLFVNSEGDSLYDR